jgi:hypothetical protein
MKNKSAVFGKRRQIFPVPFALALFLLLVWPGQAAAQSQPARSFPHPDRIRYDSQCLTIDGKDVFIYSGAFHYFRCPKELWPDRFQKIKNAGFNAVETYVPWNWCERAMPAGTNDFSKVDLQDFDDWLTMAEHFGFYVIVRPGPYICAEWATGGFPEWLLTKKPQNPLREEGWLRSDDPVFLAWSKHWYDAVCPVIARHQITRRAPGSGGVILVQVENEYDSTPFSDAVKINHIRALAVYARADGIDVPLISCWTHQVRGSADPVLRQIFDCCNFYPRWGVDSTEKEIEKLRAEQPDALLGTTELQGGWFSNVGGELSENQEGLTAAQINNLTLFVIQNGEALLNYYMLFGGTNPGDWAARDITSTYDYNAPIREWGGVGDRYQRVWAIGHLLKEHGAELARAKTIACAVTTSQNDVTVVIRCAPDGGRYLFIRTSQHDEPREGTAKVRPIIEGENQEIVFDYQLEPFGSKILYLPPGVNDAAQGEWLPKPAPTIEHPTNVLSSVTITSTKYRVDPGPSRWLKLDPGETLPQAGIEDSRFVFYRAKISSKTWTNLLVEFPGGDAVLATVNGQPVAPVGSTAGSSVFVLPAGSSSLELLYENRGYANGGENMERPGGVSGARFTSSAQIEGIPIGGWRMREVKGSRKRPEIKASFDDHDWAPVSVADVAADQLSPGQIAVFRARVQMSETDLKNVEWDLNFGRIDDEGWVYVNGESVGKATDWSRAYSFDVTEQLHPGVNVIAVVVRTHDGSGGLGAPGLSRILKDSEMPLQFLGSPAGVEKRWWRADLKDNDWQTVKMNSGLPAAGGRLTWYRMNFQLPPATPGIWVPWRLHLAAAGNGFLYLNGHAIGRYWNAGPQHDFFLPECWLHFGAGSTNQLTLSLRSTGQGATIQAATVEPYADFAETR